MSSTLSREALVETFLRLGKALVEVPEGERSWLEGEVTGLVVHFTRDFLEIVATAESGPELKLSMWLDDLALHPAESPLRRELGDFLTKLAEVPRALGTRSAARRVDGGAKDARPESDFVGSGMSPVGEDRNFPS